MSVHVQVFAPWHPKASASGMVYEHVLVAEKALGKRLPAGAHVHHVDENPRNNERRNLVICQDVAYHKLLHYRAQVRRMGGDPDVERWCGDCRAFKPFSEFNRSSSNKSVGLQTVCRGCQRVRFAQFSRGQA